jgi:CO/xanthine dehydrogenase FAD-binding subunit
VARLLDGAALEPITDVRASAAYRHAAAAELVARARARLAA